MPRRPVIRWGESDAKELEERVRKFNAKIYRTRHRHPELADIQPETIKKEDKQRLIQEFKEMPRSEFNKFMNSLERYGRRGAEKAISNEQGVSTTKWRKKEIETETATYNRQIAKERERVENIEATSRGEKIGLKRGEMGSERLNALRPKNFKFDSMKSKKELEMYEKAIKKKLKPSAKEEQDKLFKMNYIKGATRVFGEHAEYIIEKLKQLPAHVLVEAFYREQEASIEFVYSPEDLEVKLEIIEDIWQKEFGNRHENLIGYKNWSIKEENELNEWYKKEGNI